MFSKWIFVIPRKNVQVPRHSKVYRRVNSEAQNGTKFHKKICFTNSQNNLHKTKSVLTSAKCLENFESFLYGREFRVFFFLPQNCSEQNAESFLLLLFYSMEFRAFLNSTEWYGTEFQEFSVPGNSRKPFVLSILSSAESFFIGNSQPCLHINVVVFRNNLRE
jgi:hypothetical protein